MEYLLKISDWTQWNLKDPRMPWEWAALSVKLPPDSLDEADTLACGRPDEYEQWREYQNRRRAIEAAVQRGQVLGQQSSGPLSSVDHIVWARIGDRLPVESFVAWAIGEKWNLQEGLRYDLPDELSSRRSRVKKGDLERKYVGAIPTIHSLFSNQARPKKKGMQRISLQDRAGVQRGAHQDQQRPGGRAKIEWDEYSVLLWLQGNGNV